MINETYERLKQKRNRSQDELVTFLRVQAQFRKAAKELCSTIETMIEEAGALDLVPALNSGLVEIEVYPEADIDAQLNAFIASINSAVASGASYPLLDDSVGGLVRAAIREGKIEFPETGAQQARIIGLAADLFRRLPNFESASVADVLLIRTTLERPLVRFRSAVTEFARLIEGAQWDREFANEAELVFREKVAPAILEIEDLVRSSALTRLLPRHLLSTDVLGPAPASALGLLISTASESSVVAGLAAGLAVGAMRSVHAVAGGREKILGQAKGNRLYFYYQAREMLR